MNSRDRIYSLLNHKIPDRVPYGDLLISKNVINAIFPGYSYFDFCEKMDIDIVFVKRDFNFKWIDEEKGLYINEWGIIRKKGNEETDDYIDGPLKSVEDIKNYRIPDPLDENNFKSLREAVRRFKKDKIICFLSKATFNFPWNLVGNFQQYLIDLYTNPKFIYKLHSIVEDHHIVLNEKALGLGADMVALVDDYAYKDNMFISREKFLKFCLPSIQRTVESVHKRGGYIFFHSDGNYRGVIDDIIGAKIDFLHPLEPNIFDIKEIYEKHREKIIICGNIDCAVTLTSKSPKQVENEVKWLMKNIAPKGRYIICSSNTIHSKVKPQNYIAFLRAIKKYGRYPINVS